MKKPILITGIAALAIVLAFAFNSMISASVPVKTPAPSQGLVILRTLEVFGMTQSSMVTVYEDGRIEKSELAKLTSKNLEVNLGTIHSKIMEITGKGYELVMTTGGNSDNIICSTFFFKKKAD